MNRGQTVRELSELRERLESLEESRPAHSPKVELELEIERTREEISRLESMLDRQESE